MKIKAPMMKIHNNFKVLVRDGMTNEIQKEAYGENVVLTQNVTDFLSKVAEFSEDERPVGISSIAIGSGAGVPAETDTALFAETARIGATKESYELAFAESTASFKIELGESEYVGTTITELGLVARWDGKYANTYFLLSHAMLKDSEGSDISIGPKTDTQIIEIYATMYVVMASTDLGSDFKWLETNRFNTALITSAGQYGRHSTAAGYLKVCPGDVAKALTLNRVGTLDTLTADRLLSVEGWDQDIVRIILKDFGYVDFPNLSYFPVMSFTDEAIGVGDGVNTLFSLKTGWFVPGTAVLKVDGVLQTEGVDYTIMQGANQNVAYNTRPHPHPCLTVKARYGTIDGPEEWIDILGTLEFPKIHTGYQQLYLDLGESVPINAVVLNTDLIACIVTASPDGAAWTTVMNTSINGRYGYPLNNQRFRYFRLYSTNSSYCTIGSIQVYLGDGIEFTTPPAEGAAITATWDTDVPPKTSDYSYDLTAAIDWS